VKAVHYSSYTSITQLTFTQILKERGTFIFRVKHIALFYGSAGPWRWRCNCPWKRCQILAGTRVYCLRIQKFQIFQNTLSMACCP